MHHDATIHQIAKSPQCCGLYEKMVVLKKILGFQTLEDVCDTYLEDGTIVFQFVVH